MVQVQMPEDIIIRPAGPADIHRLVRILPGGMNIPLRTLYLTAETESTREFLGGAFLSAHTSPGGHKSAFFQVAVVREQLIRRIFPILLRACAAQAQTIGVQTLSFGRMVAEGDPLQGLLQQNSFSPFRTLTEYEMDAETGYKACERVCQLLQRKGKIPKEARVLSISRVSMSSVHTFIQRYLGVVGDPYFNAQDTAILDDISTVVQIGNRLIGAVIVREVDGRAEVPYDAVDIKFRKSWVTPLLWRRPFRLGIEAGYKTVRFKTNEDEFPSFHNFARRMHSRPLGRWISYGLGLAP